MQVLRLYASRKFSFTNNANQESKPKIQDQKNFFGHQTLEWMSDKVTCSTFAVKIRGQVLPQNAKKF